MTSRAVKGGEEGGTDHNDQPGLIREEREEEEVEERWCCK